jgi:membrane protein DedA with SNARE-associated domain/rhodanese-related sulfurtransferase
MQELLSLLAQYGLWLVFGLVLLERIGAPVPALPIVIVAGALVAQDRLGLVSTVLVALAACLIGDFAWYAAGRRFGARVLRLLCRISLSPDSCVKQSETRFERWGGALLVVSKFVPGLATMAAPVAGAVRVRVPVFLFFSLFGSALWVAVGMGLGAAFHAELEKVFERLEGMGSVALAAGGLLAAWIALKWWQRRRLFKMLRMARISVQELQDLMQKGERPVVVDVRSNIARQLEPRGIPGALAVQMDAVGAHLHELPTDREIILYCTCPNEESAAHVAKLLMRHGYKKVRPLHGGLDAWVDAGYAVEELHPPRGGADVVVALVPRA